MKINITFKINNTIHLTPLFDQLIKALKSDDCEKIAMYYFLIKKNIIAADRNNEKRVNAKILLKALEKKYLPFS